MELEKGKVYWFRIKRYNKTSQYIGKVISVDDLKNNVRVNIKDKYDLLITFLESEIIGLEEKGYGERKG